MAQNQKNGNGSVLGFEATLWASGASMFSLESSNKPPRVSVPSAGQWLRKLFSRVRLPDEMEEFQYPLRVNGLENILYLAAAVMANLFQYPLRVNGLENATTLTPYAPNALFQYPLRVNGLENAYFLIGNIPTMLFQYPLRVNGLENKKTLENHFRLSVFQYPLRVNGLENRGGGACQGDWEVSVPSAGQWLRKR